MNRRKFRTFDKRLRGMGAHPSSEYYRVGMIMLAMQTLATDAPVPDHLLDLSSDEEIENTTRRLLPILPVLKLDPSFWANTPEGNANFKACLKVALGEINVEVVEKDDELTVNFVGIKPEEKDTPDDKA